MAGKKRVSAKWKYVLLAVLAAVTLAVVGAAILRPMPVEPSAAPVTAPPAKKAIPTLLVIGDSYSGGSNEGGNGAKGWPVLAQTAVTSDGSRLDLILEARGGSGYVHLGPTKQTFGDALGVPRPDLAAVLVFGSINDRDKPVEEVDRAARALYADIKEQSPQAKLIVVGPSWMNDSPPDDIFPIRDVIRAAAKDAGATFVDPFAEKWFTGAAAKYIGKDGTHPDDNGHAYMANKLAPVIKKVLTGASK